MVKSSKRNARYYRGADRPNPYDYPKYIEGAKLMDYLRVRVQLELNNIFTFFVSLTVINWLFLLKWLSEKDLQKKRHQEEIKKSRTTYDRLL